MCGVALKKSKYHKIYHLLLLQQIYFETFVLIPFIHRKNKLANICSLNSKLKITCNSLKKRTKVFYNTIYMKVRDQIKQNEKHETESFNVFDLFAIRKQPMRYTQLMF